MLADFLRETDSAELAYTGSAAWFPPGNYAIAAVGGPVYYRNGQFASLASGSRSIVPRDRVLYREFGPTGGTVYCPQGSTGSVTKFELPTAGY